MSKNPNVGVVFWHGPRSKTWDRLGMAYGVASGAGRHRLPDSASPFGSWLNYAVLNSVLVGLLCAVSNSAQAAIINAVSPSLADVTAAIKSARDGDTVILPAGRAAWNSTVKITKGITLLGQTTTDPVHKTADDQTVILVGTGANGNQALIDVNTTNGKTYRITGITFNIGRTGATNFNGMIVVAGTSDAVRVDHCHFNDLRYENTRLAFWGPQGVVDHNLFFQPTNTGFPLSINHNSWNGDTGHWGDKSWAEPAYYGTSKFVFIEDNCFNNTSTVFRGFLDAANGARFVVRNNHCYNQGMGNHGTEVGRLRGVRAYELYNNDFHFTFPNGNIGGTRSGSFIAYGNRCDGVAPAQMDVTQYRMFINSNDVFYASTGANNWDNNVTEADGTHVDGHAPYLFESGTATGGSQTTLVDTSKNWPANKWAGYTVMRTGAGANPGIMLITSNTGNTLTGIYFSGYNGGMVWAAGNTYKIHKVLISMDQPCRGKGDMIINQSPINQTTGIVSWSHQALEPCYAWNNVHVPSGVTININGGTGAGVILQSGRDFFNNTPMSGYTPYTYPHPLTTSLPPSQRTASTKSGSKGYLNKRNQRTDKKVKRWKWGRAKEKSADEMEDVAPDQPSK